MTIDPGKSSTLRRALQQDVERTRLVTASDLDVDLDGHARFAERPIRHSSSSWFRVRIRFSTAHARSTEERDAEIGAVDLGILAWRRIDLMRDL